MESIMRVARWKRAGLSRLLLALLLAGAYAAAAQGVVSVQTTAAADLPGKTWKFAVVSIRRSRAGGQQEPGHATADGYRQRNLFLAIPLLTAYVPETSGGAYYTDDRVIGAPSWLYGDNDHYDIDARVDPADLADWRDPAKQPEMLRSMLEAMLAERLKLAVHRGTKESSVYSLVVGNGGPKFKETDPSKPHPGAWPLPGSGQLTMEQRDGLRITHYWGVTIGQLASTLLSGAGRTVQDRTGLNGKYDCTISAPISNEAQNGTQIGAPDPQSLSFSAAEQLGLKLEPAKGEVELLVIDHVERPTEN